MENATKALLIAAAVLVAILIISLGLVVYNMAAETIDSVNFSGQEVQAFNDKFQQYNGQSLRGSEVNAMIKTVLNNNMEQIAAGQTAAAGAPKFVKVSGTAKAADGKTTLSLSEIESSIAAKSIANTSKLYNVEVRYNNKTGLVNEIYVTDKT